VKGRFVDFDFFYYLMSGKVLLLLPFVGFRVIEWNTLCSPLLVKITQIAVMTGSCPDTHYSPLALDGRLRQ
jgi:hypothetical protein